MSRRRTKGGGSVYRMGDGGWMAQIRTTDPLTGKVVTRRKRAKTRDEAREALRLCWRR